MPHTMLDSYASRETLNSGQLCLRGDVHPERDNVEHRNRKIHLCCQRINIMKKRKIGNYDEISFRAAVGPNQSGAAQSRALLSSAAEEGHLGIRTRARWRARGCLPLLQVHIRGADERTAWAGSGEYGAWDVVLATALLICVHGSIPQSALGSASACVDNTA